MNDTSKDISKINYLAYGTLDNPDPDDLLESSGVDKGNCCEPDDRDDFDNKCLISAITDEILFET